MNAMGRGIGKGAGQSLDFKELIENVNYLNLEKTQVVNYQALQRN